MEVMDKLKVLADAAKYDVSCSSSGSDRPNTPGGVGNGAIAGICHVWSSDGRCVSLLKILFSNYCIYDCTYCVNRISNDVKRASFTPEEVADLTINFYRRNYIEGLFLSSAVFHSPDHTMEQLVKAVRKLRVEYRFNGYIHLKAIPGADFRLIYEAGQLVDRMSVNIELPSNQALETLAPEKKKDAILKPMYMIGSKISENGEEKKQFKKAPTFVPAGQSTQLIVGATPDHDYQIMRLSESLYKKFNLKRVFFSAYVPVNENPKLPVLKAPPLLREHRLYQADWLLRFYGFSADEILNDKQPNLSVDFDPKEDWALRNLQLFPMEINKVSFENLVRIPGVGIKSAQRIVAARREKSLDFDDLKKIAVVLKRARHFITCKGKYYSGLPFKEEVLREHLRQGSKTPAYEQLSLFASLAQDAVAAEQHGAVDLVGGSEGRGTSAGLSGTGNENGNGSSGMLIANPEGILPGFQSGGSILGNAAVGGSFRRNLPLLLTGSSRPDTTQGELHQ